MVLSVIGLIVAVSGGLGFILIGIFTIKFNGVGGARHKWDNAFGLIFVIAGFVLIRAAWRFSGFSISLG